MESERAHWEVKTHSTFLETEKKASKHIVNENSDQNPADVTGLRSILNKVQTMACVNIVSTHVRQKKRLISLREDMNIGRSPEYRGSSQKVERTWDIKIIIL